MATILPKVCRDKGPCFARQSGTRYCTILTEVYETGICPFRKAEKETTDGVKYPYNKYMGTTFFNGKPRSE